MKKLFLMLVVLFIFYLGLQVLFYWLSNGHETIYQLKDGTIGFEIIEKSDFNNYNYFYKISGKDIEFSFQIYKDYGKKTKVLTDIKYYEDEEYKCILPIFNDEILIDMICKNDMYYYYRNIKGKNENLDQYVASLDIYDEKQFIDTKNAKEYESLTVYKDNLIDNHFVSMKNYKGIYIINNEFDSIVKNIKLFEKDVYNQKLGVFIDNYYLVADYNESHQFNKILVINLTNLETFEIISNTAISFDSYIQGIVDNKIYLYDKDNKIQYEIDVYNKSIVKTGNEIKYYKGNWQIMSVADANKELKFQEDQNYGYEGYDKVSKVNSYYYLYKKNGNNYDVYRTNVENNDGLIYLFTTTSYQQITYANDYVYFVQENKLKVYNDSFGIKNIIDYNELEFNKNIDFHVYSK